MTHKGKVTLQDFEKAMERTDHPLKDSTYVMSQIYKAFLNAPDSSVEQSKNVVMSRTGVDYIDFAQFNNYLMTAEDQIEKGFRMVDTNHDGKISKKDFETYLIKIGDTPTPKEVDVFFNSLDTEGRGYIEFETFRDGLLFMPRMDGSRIRTAFHFLTDDLDNISSDGDFTVGNDIMKNVGYFLAGGLSGVVSRTVSTYNGEESPLEAICRTARSSVPGDRRFYRSWHLSGDQTDSHL